jgi:hypothetical protein
MVQRRQFPPVMGERLAERAPAGLLVTAVLSIVLAVGFDLNSIASLGSALALLVFSFVTLGHLRVREDTGANVVMLLLALVTAVGVLVTFTFTTLVDEPKTVTTLIAILVLSTVVDLLWKARRGSAAGHSRST